MLAVTGLNKRFKATVALRDVSFAMSQGQVVGLAGENGSGKSTFVKILCGVHRPDEGEMRWYDRHYKPSGPIDSEEAGISVFHQEIPICKNMSVAENLFLSNRMPRKRGLPDRKFMYTETIKLFNDLLHENIDPGMKMRNCSIAQRQMVLLVRALSRDAKLIVLDEPTTALTPREVAKLFTIIKRLQAKQISFIFISHMMEEIMEICDKVVVLRDGENVGELTQGDYSRSELSALIAGRTLNSDETKRNIIENEFPLEIRNYKFESHAEPLNLKLSKGEILGLAGLAGSGKSKLIESLFGIRGRHQGQLLIDGVERDIRSPGDAIHSGLGYLPEDRKTQGIFFTQHMLYNLGIASLPQWTKSGVIHPGRLAGIIQEYVEMLSIKSAGTKVSMDSLSGGNQQKVLLARWLINKPKIFLLNEPTRGIDVGAKQEICDLILQMSNMGYSFIIASSELEELITLSDRLVVMNKGRIAARFRRGEITKQNIINASA